MRSDGKGRSGISIGLVFCLLQGMAFGLGNAQSQPPANVFFSQGQAVYNPQESAKSKREALQDFQLQAIAQAASALLTPAQMEKQYRLIQDRILRQPQRYIQTYQVFSEAPAGGLYRIAGQVTISMDLLKKDLLALPQASPEGGRATPAGPGPRSERPAVEESEGVTHPPGEVTHKTSASQRTIFWAVAEKWEEDWHLPTDRRDPEGPFAASVFQELQAYGYALEFPPAGSFTPDDEGEVPENEVLAQAASLGLRQVVIGSVGPGEDEVEETRIRASLRLLNTASGKDLGEIHREMAMGETTSHETAIELASFLVPQLERQLRAVAGSAAAGEPLATGEAATAAETVVRPEEAGEVVVQIQSPDAYADWLAVETKVREQAPNLQVKGLEIGPEGSRVRLLGVDATVLKALHGTRLANGAQVEVTSLGAEGHALRLTLTKSAMSPAGSKP